MEKLKHIYLWTACGEDGVEGIISVQMHDKMYPMVTSKLSIAMAMKDNALFAAFRENKVARLVKFSDREDLEVHKK